MTDISTKVQIHDTCRLGCNGVLETVISFPQTPVGDAYRKTCEDAANLPLFPLNLCLCPNCGHLQLREVVEPELLYGNFTYRTSVSRGLIGHFQRYAEETSKNLDLLENSFILDIGSNDGSLLRFFQGQGHRVLGVDPARDIAREANEKGIETWPSYFDEDICRRIIEEKGTADLVVSNNTFANIDDIVVFFERIKRILKPGATFVFETGYAIDLAHNLIIDNIYHEHLSYFLVKPLSEFFQRQGMILYDIDQIDTKGGSVRGCVSLPGGHRAISESVKSLIELEDHRNLNNPVVFAELTKKIDMARDNLHQLLKKVMANDGKVAGYGASVGVTTMLYHFRIGDILTYLVDDNPIKHELFSPGYGLPVYPSKKLMDDFPSHVIILAWRYAKPIIENNRSYLERGGQFIVPIPTPRVITAEDVL